MNSNVASSSHNNNMFNSLIIPNEHKSVGNNHSVIIHKGKKFNYVCDINPQTISSISGTITDLAGSPIFHGGDTTGLFTYALTGIDSDNLSRLITSGEAFTQITSNAGLQTVNGIFLATHFKSSTTLHFATSAVLTNAADFVTGTGNLTFNTTAADPVVSNSSGNLNLTLIQNPGRFIAEFSIISRE